MALLCAVSELPAVCPWPLGSMCPSCPVRATNAHVAWCNASNFASVPSHSCYRSQEGLGPVGHDRKSQTLPVSRNRTGMVHARLQQLGSLDNSVAFNHSKSHAVRRHSHLRAVSEGRAGHTVPRDHLDFSSRAKQIGRGVPSGASRAVGGTACGAGQLWRHPKCPNPAVSRPEGQTAARILNLTPAFVFFSFPLCSSRHIRVRWFASLARRS